MNNKDKPYFGIYDSIEYCQKEIKLARELFGKRNTTEDQYNQMLKGLAILNLYCPEEFKITAESTITEAIRRKIYYSILWGYFDE